MSYWTGALIALLFLAFALGSRKLSDSILTGSMLFAGFGFVIGPRGLASVLFLLIVMQSTDLAIESELLAAVALTVTLSIILHGIAAAPWARVYGRAFGK